MILSVLPIHTLCSLLVITRDGGVVGGVGVAVGRGGFVDWTVQNAGLVAHTPDADQLVGHTVVIVSEYSGRKSVALGTE